MKRLILIFSSLLLCVNDCSIPCKTTDFKANQITNVSTSYKFNINHNEKDLFEEDLVRTNLISLNAIDLELSSFTFYKMNFNGVYYVADIKDSQSNGLVELKIISNCTLYNNFGEYQDLRGENYILEILRYDYTNDKLYKTFSKLDSNTVKKIIENSSEISEESPEYFNLLASLNAEFTYRSKYSKESNIENYSLSLDKPQVDNQSILDHYLTVAKSNSDADMIPIENNQEGYIYSFDDSIVNLIPKSYFANNGTYSGGGSEWGYFVKTYNDLGNNKISSVLVYDIFTISSDIKTPDLTEIKVVLHKNFKYYFDSDVVVGDVDNNYCLGNPQYKASLRYFEPNNVENPASHPNPEDGNNLYNPLDDYGYSFGNVATKMLGTFKNSRGIEDNANIFFKFIISALSDLVVTGALSAANIPLGASFLISQAAGLITDLITSSLFKKAKNESPFVDLGNYNFSFDSVSFNDYSSFEDMRKNKALLKEIGVLVPNNSGDYLSPERNKPLLFKNQNHYITYRINMVRSERNDDYYALISHCFKAEVFNDTTNIFSWYPEFLGTSTAKWAYSTGINSKPLTINAYAKGNKYNLSFGENTSQIVYFTPAKSGTYSFFIDNAYAYTFASLYDENLNLQKTKKTNDITYIDKWTNKIKIAQNNCLTLNSYLTANKKYKIVIYRKNDSNVRLFGTSNIEILMVNGSINSISSSATFKRNTKVISGNESNLLSFVPSMTDIYTFVATDEYSGVLDTYLEVRDKNQQIIYKSDNGAGSSRAFVALTLAKGIRYYIVSRNKTSSHTSYKIYTFAEDYLPYISGSNRNASIRMNFNGIKHYYYLVHYNRAYNGKLILEFLYTNITRTPIKVELTDYKGTLKYNYSISDSNYNSFSVSSNTFYVLHVFTKSSSSNEYINFCLS